MAYEDGSATTPTTSPVIEMPITVFSPSGTTPLVNSTNASNIDTAENNFIADNFSNGILSENSEYQNTNSSGGLVYYDAAARTTTILNPDTAEISVYNANTNRLTIYTDNPETSGYSLYIDPESGVGFSTEGTVSNGNGASFPVNSSTLQNFYPTAGINLDAVVADYNSNPFRLEPNTILHNSNDGFSYVDYRPVYQVNSSGDITGGESPSDFKYYFEKAGFVGPYDINNYETYTDFYEANKNLDIFGTLSNQFSDSIETLIDKNGEIGIAWADLDTTYNQILSEFDDLFNVGVLDISAALSPLKESYSKAKVEIEEFLSKVASEYSRVSAEKARILEERAREEAARKAAQSPSAPQ